MSADRESLTPALVSSALLRVADLWPEGLGAVPGSYELALKRDADTIRALAQFWLEAQAERSGLA
jgi:hypothetical protein